jgi:MscS family membrane protein
MRHIARLVGFGRRPRILTCASVVALVLLSLLAAASAPAGTQPRSGTNAGTLNAGLGTAPPDVQRTTPAATWRSFLTLAGARRFDAAAHTLDLQEIAAAEQPKVGALVAEQLYQVLRALQVSREAVTSENPEGPTIQGRAVTSVLVAEFERAGIRGEVRLHHATAPDGGRAWLFEPRTIASAPFWHRVLVRGEPALGAEPLNPGLGTTPPEVRRGSPRETIAGFENVCEAGRFDVAAHYLDLSEIPSAEQAGAGPRLARRLMVGLIRRAWIDPRTVSADPNGMPEVGVPDNEERVVVVPVGRREVPIVLNHRWDAELGHVWTFAPATVSAIGNLYAFPWTIWLVDHLPGFLFTQSVAELQLWQWLAILLTLVLGWFVSRQAGHLLLHLLARLARRTVMAWDDVVVAALEGPAAFILWAALLVIAAPSFGLSPAAQDLARTSWKLLALLGVGWFLIRFVDGSAAHLRSAAVGADQPSVGLLPIFSRFAKVLVALFVVLGALTALGQNVTGWLAGLGIVGVAIAFAAQKTLENVLGAMAIAGDRPFQIGDFVAIGQDTGMVEDVGLRSTRMRTLARTLVTIPNGVVVSGRVENFAARDQILFNPTLRLAYGTSAAQLTLILDDIKRLLAADRRVASDGMRVRFVGFGDASLQAEIFCAIATRDFYAFTAIAEELNLAIMEIVAAAGSAFALPVHPPYAGAVGAIDAVKADAAAREVASRRSRGELSVPEMSPDLARRLRDAGAKGDRERG